jgi:hypothetical protein
MKDLKRQLVAGDPVARESGLSALDAQSMRQRMLVEARTSPAATTSWWLRPLVLAGALAACLLLAIGIGTRLNVNEGRIAPPAARVPTTRQLQFATPGGTRIIWTFHQQLEL